MHCTFLSKNILGDVDNYISYLIDNGFEKIVHYQVENTDNYLRIYWNNDLQILIHFDDFINSFSDGSGDGKVEVNGGHGIHLFARLPEYSRYDCSKHGVGQGIFHCVYDTRCDIQNLIEIHKDDLVPFRKDSFLIHLWHSKIHYDNLDNTIERMRKLRRFHNSVRACLPDWLREDIPIQKV